MTERFITKEACTNLLIDYDVLTSKAWNSAIDFIFSVVSCNLHINSGVDWSVADELVGERDKFRLVTVELDSTFTELVSF